MANEDGFPGLHEQVDPPTIHLHILLDISTSMFSRWSQTISGLNEYIESLRMDENPYRVTITKFGQEYEVSDLYTDVDLDKVAKFDEKKFYPNGQGTALWGAVGMSLKKIDTSEPVLFIVITDGEENSSHTYSSESVDKLIEQRKALGNYTFAYLGVAKEAWGQEAQIQAFQQSNSNVAGDDYNTGTYKNLGTLTAAYSSCLRSSSLSGGARAMSVNNFFSPEPIVVEMAEDAHEETQ